MEGENTDGNMCVICREQLHGDDNKEVYETKCGHKFHKDCIVNYCGYLNKHLDMNFSFMTCPICRTQLNCRLIDGEDIFPERTKEKDKTSYVELTNFQKALEIIPEDEYELITEPNDIHVPELNLSNEDKELIFREIEKRKKLGGKKIGKSKKSRKSKKSKKSKKSRKSRKKTTNRKK